MNFSCSYILNTARYNALINVLQSHQFHLKKFLLWNHCENKCRHEKLIKLWCLLLIWYILVNCPFCSCIWHVLIYSFFFAENCRIMESLLCQKMILKDWITWPICKYRRVIFSRSWSMVFCSLHRLWEMLQIRSRASVNLKD